MKSLLSSCLLLATLSNVVLSQSKRISILYDSINVCNLCDCISDENNFDINCKMRHLQHVPCGIYSNVTSLDLSSNCIRKLENNSFTGLSHLRKLDLSYNSIDIIEIGTFWPLKNLEELLLVETHLFLLQKSLSPGVFRGLLNVKSVMLHGNVDALLANASRLPAQTFSDLVGLEELTIDGTSSIMFGLGFENLTNFKNLTMSGSIGYCNIIRLESQTFFYVPYLQYISIINCNLGYIASDAFKPLKNLQTLNLSENVALGFNNFGKSLEGLKYTSIRVLYVTSIVSPYGTGSMLSSDDVQHLHETKLEEVYMDKNALEYIKYGVLSKFPPTLQKLSFRENRLVFTLFMYEIFNIKSLLVFDAGNQQPRIQSRKQSKGIKRSVNVQAKYFNTSGNKNSIHVVFTHAQDQRKDTSFVKLPNDARTLQNKSIVWKDLNPNKFQRDVTKGTRYFKSFGKDTNNAVQDLNYILPKGEEIIPDQNNVLIYKAKRPVIINAALGLKPNISMTTTKSPSPKIVLTTLICSGSESNFVLLDFNGVENNITYIDISDNYIPGLGNSSFAGLTKVEFLNLSNNHIDNLEPLTFAPLQSLMNLDLSNNKLRNSINESSAWNFFEALHNLQTMNISRNSISYIPPNTFQSLHQMQLLDAKFNDLNDFDVNFENLSLLRMLDLSNNSLPFLKTKILNNLDNLAKVHNISLDLSGNKMLCTCTTLPFIRWLRMTNVTLNNKSQYFCSLENGTIRYISEAALLSQLEESCKSYLLFYVGAAIGGTFALAFTIFFLIYRNRWKLRYLYYMTKLKLPTKPSTNTEDSFINAGFISYDDEDVLFVKNCMIEELEVNRGHTLIVKDRDFLPGEVLTMAILKAMRESRKTISLISRGSLQNKWWTFEMHMAQIESIYMNRNVLILIFLEDIPCKDLPLYVLNLLQIVPYIEYPSDTQAQCAFWSKLHEYINER